MGVAASKKQQERQNGGDRQRVGLHVRGGLAGMAVSKPVESDPRYVQKLQEKHQELLQKSNARMGTGGWSGSGGCRTGLRGGGKATKSRGEGPFFLGAVKKPCFEGMGGGARQEKGYGESR